MKIISMRERGKRRNESRNSDCEGGTGSDEEADHNNREAGGTGAIPAGAHAAFLFSL